jgi:hypothetical protein
MSKRKREALPRLVVVSQEARRITRRSLLKEASKKTERAERAVRVVRVVKAEASREKVRERKCPRMKARMKARAKEKMKERVKARERVRERVRERARKKEKTTKMKKTTRPMVNQSRVMPMSKLQEKEARMRVMTTKAPERPTWVRSKSDTVFSSRVRINRISEHLLWSIYNFGKGEFFGESAKGVSQINCFVGRALYAF